MRFNQPLNYAGKYESKGIKTNCAKCGTEFVKRCPTHKICPDCRTKKNLKSGQEKSKWTLEKNKAYQRAYYQKHKRELNEQRKVNNCRQRHNNCFDCPYEDCIRD